VPIETVDAGVTSDNPVEQAPAVAVLPPDAAPAPPGPAPATPPRAKPIPPLPVAPSSTASIAPAVQEQIDLGLASARRAMQKRDGMNCLAAVNALPVNVPVMIGHNIEFHRAQCEMLRGECERGIKRMNEAQDGMGVPPSGEMAAIGMCPISGPYEVRLKRLMVQSYAATTAGLCKPYIKHARTLAGEATAANEKIMIAGVLRHLAKCVGNAGDCAEAEALWKISGTLDEHGNKWDVDKCTAPAALAVTPAVKAAMSMQAFNDALAAAQQSILRRDTRSCRDLVAIADIPQGMESSYNLVAGFCTMMLGDCKAGSDLVQKVYPNHPQTVASNQDIYCPIAGSLDQRLARLRMQLLTFADKRISTPRVEWCSHLIGPAKTAAREAQSADQRAAAAKVLQHAAWCISTAGRCGEANDLWSLSVATDGSASTTPALSAKCT
jgi:hypothetical protein